MIRRLRLGRGRRRAPRRAAPPLNPDDIGGALWVLNTPAVVGLWWVGAHRSGDVAERRP